MRLSDVICNPDMRCKVRTVRSMHVLWAHCTALCIVLRPIGSHAPRAPVPLHRGSRSMPHVLSGSHITAFPGSWLQPRAALALLVSSPSSSPLPPLPTRQLVLRLLADNAWFTPRSHLVRLEQAGGLATHRWAHERTSRAPSEGHDGGEPLQRGRLSCRIWEDLTSGAFRPR